MFTLTFIFNRDISNDDCKPETRPGPLELSDDFRLVSIFTHTSAFMLPSGTELIVPGLITLMYPVCGSLRHHIFVFFFEVGAASFIHCVFLPLGLTIRYFCPRHHLYADATKVSSSASQLHRVCTTMQYSKNLGARH